MATPNKTRGEYRPFYEALAYGTDFRKLSPDGKLAFYTIKLLSGATGLRSWPALLESLAELTGITTGRARKAVAELTAAQWIEYEDGIVWVIRGLDFEPQVSHGQKHRKWIQTEISGLPSAPIITRFRKRYRAFFTDTPSPTPSHSPPDSLSNGVPDIPCDTTTPSPSPSLPKDHSASDPKPPHALGTQAERAADFSQHLDAAVAEIPHDDARSALRRLLDERRIADTSWPGWVRRVIGWTQGQATSGMRPVPWQAIAEGIGEALDGNPSGPLNAHFLLRCAETARDRASSSAPGAVAEESWDTMIAREQEKIARGEVAT